ncbi:Firmicu-CTERM sorting domain-containing protein [Levilactobacillus andaensis]|uniref:Firmicu-CTERM sorting domain-containing protein n=1 Tax=Levilactobacillus andaensis TaxID=2799570 RepID=UPI001941B25A|nr:Firmicu-CTERM sorting domain-containing protein [Levilactobacillus andaensis]
MRKSLFIILACLALAFFGSSPIAAYAAGDTGANSKLNISIDGSFGDWNDKPTTTFSNGAKGSLVADDSNIYFYLNMDPDDSGHGYLSLPSRSFTLNVGKKSYDISISKARGLGAGKSASVSVSANGSAISGAQAMMTRPKDSHGNHDVIEMSLPFAGLGVVATSSQNISISNSDLGGQTLTTTGGSTGGVILVAIGFSIAIVAVVQITRRRRKLA